MFGGLLNKAKGGLKGFGSKIGGAAKKTGGLFGRIGRGIGGAAKKTGGMFGGLLNKAKGGLKGFGAKIGRGFGGAAKKTGGLFGRIGGAAKKIGGGLFGLAKKGLGGFKNSLSNLINKAKGGKTPKLAPLSPAAQAANAKGKAFCSANCMINPMAAEKKCLDAGKLIPCKRCTGRPGMDASKKSVCELVCNGNLPASPCDFYGYVNNKKKGVNLTLLSKFGLTIVRRKYRQ